jgi:hypothetical protein
MWLLVVQFVDWCCCLCRMGSRDFLDRPAANGGVRNFERACPECVREYPEPLLEGVLDARSARSAVQGRLCCLHLAVGGAVEHSVRHPDVPAVEYHAEESDGEAEYGAEIPVRRHGHMDVLEPFSWYGRMLRQLHEGWPRADNFSSSLVSVC